VQTIVETFGKRRVAFGLNWVPFEETVQESIQNALGSSHDLESMRIWYVKTGVQKRRKKDPVTAEETHPLTIGFGIQSGSSKGVRSAGQIVAGLARDALYFVELADGQCWYAGVREGQVIASTDVVGPTAEVSVKVVSLGSVLNLPIFADTQTAIEGFDVTEPFDFAAVVGKTKAPLLRSLGNKGAGLGPIVAAIVVAGT
jgi:hypothetical protein